MRPLPFDAIELGPRPGTLSVTLTRILGRTLTCAMVPLLTHGCAHRTLYVQDAELERAVPALRERGEAAVRTTDNVVTDVKANEVVSTVSGDVAVLAWVNERCEPEGRCRFENHGVSITRVDPAPTYRVLEILSVTVVAIGASAGVACAVGALCKDPDDARMAGIITLSALGAVVLGGFIALAACKSCWAFH